MITFSRLFIPLSLACYHLSFSHIQVIVDDFFLVLSDAGAVVCVGSEWHRFPSSFFVPDYVGEVRWIDDGFSGLLPFPFNSTLGGTSAGPPYFNNKNKASPEQFVSLLPQISCTLVLSLKQLGFPEIHVLLIY